MTIYTTPQSFEDPTPSVGQRFGSALGEGLSSGLQLLLQSKLQRMGEREKLSQLQSILGGSDVPGQDIEVDFLDSARPQTPFRAEDLTDAQVLAINQLDPKMGALLQNQKTAAGREVGSKFKETKEIRKEILNQSKAAKENNTRLDRMGKLNKSGKLINPLYNATLKKLGMDVAALKNPDSQEFDKLSNDMFKNIREIFGNRINVIEIQTFLKTIPTLSQTQEGRSRVIRNLKLLNRGAQERLKAMKEITKENRGVPPYDIGEQIEERISPELDKMSAEFIAGPSEEKPQPEKVQRVRNPQTGEILEWTGTQWKKVKS